MPSLHPKEALALSRKAFSVALYPPLIRAILTAVSAEVVPRVTIMRQGDLPVLALEYAKGTLRLIAQASDTSFKIQLLNGGCVVRVWSAFQDPNDELVIIGADHPSEVTSGATSLRWTNFTLRPDIAGEIRLNASSDRPELVSDIAKVIQNHLAIERP